MDDLHNQNHEDLEHLRDYIEAVKHETAPEDWARSARQSLHDSLQSQKQEKWIMRLFNNPKHGGLKWATAIALAAIIIALMIGIGPHIGGSTNANAYEVFVMKFRSAATVMFTQTVHLKGMPGMPEASNKIMYKAPGRSRTETFNGCVNIFDYNKRTSLVINPHDKKCTFIELEPQRIGLVERLSTLPDRTTETLPVKQLDGRSVKGYVVHENGSDITLWVDASTGDPVSAELDMFNTPGAQIVITDFKLDVPLDDSIFDMTPPAGYAVELKPTESTEQDLIVFLRTWATHPRHKDGAFPPSLNFIELTTETGLMMASPYKKDKAKLRHWMDFIQGMEKDSDWHYAGRDVKLGDAATPIFWYKPAGSKVYRVIMGDLSIKEAETAPHPNLPKNL